MTYAYRDQLIEALASVPLTPEQIDTVLPSLEKMNSFITKRSPLRDESAYWHFSDKITRCAAILGIDKKTYIEKAALKQPSLFAQSPETIDDNITRAATLLGIDKKTYIEKAALKQPSLFVQSPETIDDNITRAAALLGIDKKDYIEKAVLKHPSLFVQSPETIDDNITRSAALLGIDKKNYIEKTALKHPSLFYQSPETIDDNITRTAALLGIDKKNYIEKAALKRPQLFSQSPETIYDNITRSAALFGIDKKNYIEKAALKQPSLFVQSPETIKRNFNYMADAYAKGYIKTDDLMASCLSFPVSFSIAPANITLRSIHAHITGRLYTLSSFLTGLGRSKADLEKVVVSHFRDQFERTGKGLRAVQVMAEAGIISALPDWAPAPSAPLRQRTRAPA